MVFFRLSECLVDTTDNLQINIRLRVLINELIHLSDREIAEHFWHCLTGSDKYKFLPGASCYATLHDLIGKYFMITQDRVPPSPTKHADIPLPMEAYSYVKGFSFNESPYSMA